MRTSVTLLALAFMSLAAGCGKGAKGDCPQLDICGSTDGHAPASDTPWKVTNFCQVAPVRPAQPGDVNDFTTMNPAAPTVAPPQPMPVLTQQTTSGDWCSNLTYAADDTVTNVSLWHRAPEISSNPAKPSTIIFGKDGSYLTKLQLDVPISPNFARRCPLEVPPEQDSTHFARRCLFANGAVAPTCDKLATALTAYYKPPNMSVPPAFDNIFCCDADDGGCDCTYSFNLQIDDSGNWKPDPQDQTVLLQDSTTLQFNGATNNAQSSTTTLRSSFCASPGQLELSGVRGGSLSNVQGLRTLVLTPMM